MNSSVSFRYIAITSRSVCPVTIPERLQTLLELEVDAIQIRDKNLSDRIHYRWLHNRGSGDTSFFINGRVDIAEISECEGIHRPSSGLPLDVLEKISTMEMTFGCSTHTIAEVQKAEEDGWDYVTFGPVFPTPSKPELSCEEIPGLEKLSEASESVDLPVFALGGIAPERVHQCLDAGAYGVAGIRALFEPEDPRKNWQKIQQYLPGRNTAGDYGE